jgi:hypothetical protein
MGLFLLKERKIDQQGAEDDDYNHFFGGREFHP